MKQKNRFSISGLKKLSAKFHITVGLTVMVITAYLVAGLLGLIPDRHQALVDGRIRLAEALTASSVEFVSQGQFKSLDAVLRIVVERDDQVQSVAVRRGDGESVVTVGAHDLFWRPMSGQYSTESQIKVPIWSGDRAWGHLELRFLPLAADGLLWGLLSKERAQLIAYLALVGFFGFYLYLSRMLRHLDPSQAVPERVRSALDTMTQGIVVIDLKGYLVLVNQSFAELCDSTSDALIGQSIKALPWVAANGERQADSELPWSTTTVGHGNNTAGMVYLRDGEGRKRTLMVRCSPVMGAEQQQRGLLIGLEDVTELEEKEVQLRESKLEAERANRAKSEFLANMSHEIRTPMNSILGFTELLRRSRQIDGNDWRRHLNTIHSSGRQLLELINGILDLSKVESGKLEVERIDFEPHRVAAEVVQAMTVQSSAKGLTLNLRADGALPRTICSDPARLRQILINLIGNAIKFTSQGNIDVVVRLATSSAGPSYEIAVSDSGIGMPKDKLESIFGAFTQADSSVTRRFGGTGLGLAISKQFALALGGDIRVTSEPGVGSTFTLSLDPGPLDEAEYLEPERLGDPDHWATPANNDRERKAARWTQGANPLHGLRVLVADDSEQNRELLKIVLGDEGATVVDAENGEIALLRATEVEFDLILLDIQMPVMDGFTAIAKMRERDVNTPIVALTAHAMEGFENKLLEAGFNSYATKPIDFDALLGVIGRVLSIDPQDPVWSSETVAATEVEFEALEHPEVADGPAIFSALPTHNERYHRIVAHFIEQLDAQIVAMRSALETGDAAALAEIAHFLKGAGGTVGFDVFTEPASELENLARAGDLESSTSLVATLENIARRVTADPRPQAA